MRSIRELKSVPSDWASASIFDARAFFIGESAAKVHKLTHVSPGKVRGACGIVARVAASGSRTASWAASEVNCPTCTR